MGFRFSFKPHLHGDANVAFRFRFVKKRFLPQRALAGVSKTQTKILKLGQSLGPR